MSNKRCYINPRRFALVAGPLLCGALFLPHAHSQPLGDAEKVPDLLVQAAYSPSPARLLAMANSRLDTSLLQ